MSERDGQDILWKGMIKSGPIDMKVANLEKEDTYEPVSAEDTHRVVN